MLKEIIKLWTHQREALTLAMDKKDFALFMEMGTGKTAVQINILRNQFMKNNRLMRTLILCPPVMIETWRREIFKHSTFGEHVTVLTGTGVARARMMLEIIKSGRGAVVVTNYESLQMKDLYAKLLAYNFEILVCDESQKLKNYKAVRTKLATAIADKATHRYLLSGTPITNNPMDIYAQYRILDSGDTFGNNFFAFRGRYFVDKNAGMPIQKYYPDWRPTPGLEKTFNELIYKKAVRYLKKDCLDLPPFVRKQVVVELGKEQGRMYDEMRRDFVTYLDTHACVATLAITKALRMQQVTSGFFKSDTEYLHRFVDNPRIDALRELLETITPSAKVIVWAMFNDNYTAIEGVCKELELVPAFLIGGMTDKSRTESIDKFQNDPACRVMIANQLAGGVGVTLTAASYCIFYSRNFSLEADLQAEARCYRGGSEIHTKVTRIDLVARDTIDEVVLEALLRKENLANNILAIKGRDF